METVEFFRKEKISPSTTWISDLAQVYCYLVEGRERAVLIDTGCGLGNLREFVSTLTDRPVSVLLTHGHADHAGGAGWFDEVYLSPKDWQLVKSHDTMAMKMGYAQGVLGEQFGGFSEKDFCPPRTADYLPLKEGQVFDLGGVTLEAVALPGHTQGMTAVWNREERSILLGDGCNNWVYLWLEESSTVEDYRKALLELKAREGQYDTVYLSHGSRVVEKRVLDEVIELCGQLLAGQSDRFPFEVPPAFAGRHALAAKAVDGRLHRLDGKLGNIVYDPARVWNEKR